MANHVIPNANLWNALRAWVDSQESWERENGISAITPAQLDIIEKLIFAEETVSNDGSGYISNLNEYCQKRCNGQVDYSKEEHIPPGYRGGGGRWRVFCRLPWCDQTFPQPGYGFSEDQVPPTFPSKKLAKQFAAKSALEYISHKATSRASTALSWTSPVAGAAATNATDSASYAPLKRARREVPTSDSGVPLSSSDAVRARPGSAGPSSAEDKEQQAEAQEKSPKIQQMVRDLAGRLNCKVPTYSISAEPGRPGFFSGEALWWQEPLAPEQTLRVQGVFGESQAAEQLAGMVWEWMEKEGQKRDADLAAILEGITEEP